MAKDPAFLFYSSDFLTGTIFMTDAQVGKYVRLLCALHQHGGIIDKATFDQIVGDDKLIRAKFQESDEGFFNERLLKEMGTRAKKSSNLSANAKQRWEQLKSKSNAIALHRHMPTENENESVIENEIEGGKGGYPNPEAAIDPLFLEGVKASGAYPGVDIDREVQRFILKVKTSPSVYRGHGNEGLKSAFLYQIKFAIPEKNGQKRVKSFNIDAI